MLRERSDMLGRFGRSPSAPLLLRLIEHHQRPVRQILPRARIARLPAERLQPVEAIDIRRTTRLHRFANVVNAAQRLARTGQSRYELDRHDEPPPEGARI